MQLKGQDLAVMTSPTAPIAMERIEGVSLDSNVDPAPTSEPIVLRPCDILFVRGSSWYSRAVLWASREPGEQPSMISHVGLVDTPGTLATAEILEAVLRVRRGTIGEFYRGKPSLLTVARPFTLSERQRKVILEKSRSMEGRAYGYGKLFLHLLDSLLGHAYLFRRLARSRMPICSWHLASSFAAGSRLESKSERLSRMIFGTSASSATIATPGRWGENSGASTSTWIGRSPKWSDSALRTCSSTRKTPAHERGCCAL